MAGRDNSEVPMEIGRVKRLGAPVKKKKKIFHKWMGREKRDFLPL